MWDFCGLLWQRVQHTVGVQAPARGQSPAGKPVYVLKQKWSPKPPNPSWQTKGRPIRWLLNRVNQVQCHLRILHGDRIGSHFHLEALEDVARELTHPPFPVCHTSDTNRLHAASVVRDILHGTTSFQQLESVRNIIHHIRSRLDHLRAVGEHEDQQTASNRWREWLLEGLSKGARRAHRWTRTREAPLVPEHQQGHEHACSTMPYERLRAEFDRLRELWQCTNIEKEHGYGDHTSLESVDPDDEGFVCV